MVAPTASLQETRVYGDGAITGDKLMVAPQLASALTPSTFRFDSGDNVTGFEIPSVSASDRYGGRLVFDSAVDMTNDKWLMFRGYYEEFNLFPVLDTLANGGLCVLLYDASNNYVQYNYHGQGWNNREGLLGGWQTNAFDARGADIFIDLDFPADASSGTIDLSAVTGVELHSRFTASRTTVPIFLGRITLAKAWLILDGETANKATFDTLYDEVQTQANTWSYFKGMVNLNYDFDGQIGQAYSCRKDIHIGNGTTHVEFRDVGFSMSFYPTRDNDAGNLGDTNDGSMPHVLADPSSREFVVNQSATDVVELISGRWAGWDTIGGDWHWECQGNVAGTCLVSSNSFFRASYVRIGHSTHTNSSYDDVENVEVTPDSTLTNCSIRNCGGKGLYLIGGAGDYSACDVDFEDSFTGDEITVADNAAGTYTVTGITAGHTINIHNESATSAITVTIPQGVGFTTSTAGGTVTIAQPSNTFTIVSSEVGSLIQVFLSGTQTLLDSTTGSVLNFTHTGQTVDYIVMKAGFIIQRFTGVSLSGNSSVSVNLVPDPVYFSGHGLTYSTDLSYNGTLTLNTIANGDAVYSALIDAYINETSLYNTPFKLQANGPTSLIFNDDMEFDGLASLNNWKRAGVQYLDSLGVLTAAWAAIFTLSSGIPAGALAEYQQAAGSGTTDAINTGAIDELIQIYGDATHGNFTRDTHLTVKYQENGYQQIRVDVVDLYNLSTVQAVAYPIATPFVSLAASSGDPAISITIVDHTAAPINIGGKLFSYEVQDNGANSGESLLREINYNNSLDATYQGKDPFNWPDIVGELGGSYDTLLGPVEGESGDFGFYVSRGGDDHPDFSRFQSDDGTYYVPPTLAGVAAPSITADRVQLYNITTDTLIETVSGVTGYSKTWVNGTDATAGDVLRFRAVSGDKLEFETSVIATGDSTVTILNSLQDDVVYTSYGIDGSTVTEYVADYPNIQVDINDPDNIFFIDRFYSWWKYNLTTASGIEDFWGGVTAIDTSNIIIHNSVIDLFFDNVKSTSARQGDKIVIQREDGIYLQAAPTSGGGGLGFYYTGIGYSTSSGSGLDSTERAKLLGLYDYNPAVKVLEGSTTDEQALRLILAEAAGKVSVAGNTVRFRDQADTKDRIVATTDTNGQRTSITTDTN